jgi:hypothetical protein
LAIESGSEWVTTDRDFSRFPGCDGIIRWRMGMARSVLLLGRLGGVVEDAQQ